MLAPCGPGGIGSSPIYTEQKENLVKIDINEKVM